MEIPLRRANTPRSKTKENDEHQHFVLVVDDNGLSRKLASRMLESMNYSVDTASSGKQALKLIETKLYDVILMDCQMPEMDGFTTTREIRKSKGANFLTPIIALTAHATTRDRDQCLSCMDGYLTKPLRKESLSEALQQWVGQRSSQEGSDTF